MGECVAAVAGAGEDVLAGADSGHRGVPSSTAEQSARGCIVAASCTPETRALSGAVRRHLGHVAMRRHSRAVASPRRRRIGITTYFAPNTTALGLIPNPVSRS